MSDTRKKVLFIVNPISGSGRKGAVYRHIHRHADRKRIDYSVCHTRYAGHATELARRAITKGYDIVVAVGGDGTINEVASVVVHTPVALGIVPCGSGNGLARHLQIPLDTVKAIRLINETTIHCLDYGRINDRPFFCTCGIGFDAFISLKFADSSKRGPLTYLENVLREGLNYRSENYIIENEDGTERHEAFLIACANASQYGNNAYIAPQASMKDGLMDVIIMKPFNAFEAPQIALQLFNKTLLSNDHIETFQARKIRITRTDDGPVHCDGDPFTTGREILVELIPNSFNVVVNPAAQGRNKSFLQLANEDVLRWWHKQQELLRKPQVAMKRFNKNLLGKFHKN